MLIPKLLQKSLLTKTFKSIMVKKLNEGCTIKNTVFNNYSTGARQVDILLVPKEYKNYSFEDVFYPNNNERTKYYLNGSLINYIEGTFNLNRPPEYNLKQYYDYLSSIYSEDLSGDVNGTNKEFTFQNEKIKPNTLIMDVDGSEIRDSTQYLKTNTLVKNNISYGYYHIQTIDYNGNLFIWGRDNYGQISHSPMSLNKKWKQIDSGNYHSGAIDDTGDLYMWGYDNYLQVSDMPTGKKWSYIDCGQDFTAGIDDIGQLFVWGDNGNGQIDNIPTGKTWEKVYCGSNGLVGIDNLGDIYVWGYNGHSQITNTPTGKKWVKASYGDYQIGAIDDTGDLYMWGDDGNTECSGMPEGKKWVDISCGSNFTAGIDDNGQLFIWGDDTYQQISDMPLGKKWISVSCGGIGITAIDNTGDLYVWGYNGYNQIDDKPVREELKSLKKWFLVGDLLNTSDERVGYIYYYNSKIILDSQPTTSLTQEYDYLTYIENENPIGSIDGENKDFELQNTNIQSNSIQMYVDDREIPIYDNNNGILYGTDGIYNILENSVELFIDNNDDFQNYVFDDGLGNIVNKDLEIKGSIDYTTGILILNGQYQQYRIKQNYFCDIELEDIPLEYYFIKNRQVGQNNYVVENYPIYFDENEYYILGKCNYDNDVGVYLNGQFYSLVDSSIDNYSQNLKANELLKNQNNFENILNDDYQVKQIVNSKTDINIILKDQQLLTVFQNNQNSMKIFQESSFQIKQMVENCQVQMDIIQNNEISINQIKNNKNQVKYLFLNIESDNINFKIQQGKFLQGLVQLDPQNYQDLDQLQQSETQINQIVYNNEQFELILNSKVQIEQFISNINFWQYLYDNDLSEKILKIYNNKYQFSIIKNDNQIFKNFITSFQEISPQQYQDLEQIQINNSQMNQIVQNNKQVDQIQENEMQLDIFQQQEIQSVKIITSRQGLDYSQFTTMNQVQQDSLCVDKIINKQNDWLFKLPIQQAKILSQKIGESYTLIQDLDQVQQSDSIREQFSYINDILFNNSIVTTFELSEGSTAVDLTGTYSSDAVNVTYESGLFGKNASCFDGSAFISGGGGNSAGDIRINNRFVKTVSCWIKIDNLISDNTVWSSGKVSNGINRTSCQINNGYFNITTIQGEYEIVKTETNRFNREWTHLVFSGNKVYINGEFQFYFDSGEMGINADTYGFYIGQAGAYDYGYITHSSYGKPFKGLIQQMRIFNRELNKYEIRFLYKQA